MFSLPRLPRLLVLGHELFDRAKKTGNGDDATPEFATAVGCCSATAVEQGLQIGCRML